MPARWKTERRCARACWHRSANIHDHSIRRLDARLKAPHLSIGDMAPSRRKNYPHLAQPVGPYVQAEKHNGMLFLSGLTALGSSAQGRGIAEQADAIFKSIASIASMEHTDLSSLVKVTVFVTNLKFVRELRAVLSNHFGDYSPMTSLVQIGKLFSPDVLIEVEAVLAIP